MIDKNFLKSKKWKDFRQQLRIKRKFCQLTGSKLVKSFNLHHLDTNYENYTNLSDEERFACLNPRSHDMVEFVWRTTDWRETIKNLISLMEQMEKYKGENK